MPTKKAPTTHEPSKSIPVFTSEVAEEHHRNYAEAMVSPEVSAFRVFSACERKGLKDQLDTPAMIRLLKDVGESVNRGDMGHAEKMLMAQATGLQTLFTRLIERAMDQSHMPNLEAFMRLALRAQSQCRTTLETLATIKNPPIFARQANIAHGNQQVNNNLVAPSRPGEIENAPNKLSGHEHELLQDTRASRQTGGADQAMATVEAFDRAKDG